MIGSDNVPLSLRIDRLCRSGRTEPWRVSWDQDNLVGVIFDVLQEIEMIPPTIIHSFRSNLSKISIVHEPAGCVVAWDERFFDYVLAQLMQLPYELEIVKRPLVGWLLQYVGETHAFSDPHYAIKLHRAAASVRISSEETMVCSSDFLRTVEFCFRIMRTFVLVHELGHIALKNPKVRERELKNFGSIIGLLKVELSDPELRTLLQGHYRFTESPNEFVKEIVKLSSNNNVSEEMLVDIFALGRLIELESALLERSKSGQSDEQVAWMFSLIYESIMLLYFITATMNGMREWFKPKSIKQNFTMDQFGSVRTLNARFDIRGRLWMIFVAQKLGHDLRRVELVRQFKAGLKDRYLNTQLPIYQQLLVRFNRRKLLQDTDNFRSEISEKEARKQAADVYGFST